MPEKKTTRRKFLETTGLVATAAAVSPFIRSAEAAISAVSMTDAPFTLPTLNYDYKALEPHIDAQTMEIHHSRHH
ncbi:MAG TPA: twin-arginine translocation signal domain-containing protein, partial [bacterium]|nr:twin-arginine translocation signal domain-containing protein [bacterium]